MSEEKRQHPFEQMMFGGRRKNQEVPTLQQGENKTDGGSLLDGVQSIMNSIDELKPLYKKISPFLKNGK
ncbi:hypothetical protein LCL96_11155 [Rossellomorea aquimaris]|uniref:hypothetical protein n=1 Tax=Rossellomorea TaxID=2837508 RepID=UPI001CD46FE7|nr:hypothetical protein [Rossellomorea aquimaris]MCA1059501.1 hypothetical protein [Rossellomorea aquimaris]